MKTSSFIKHQTDRIGLFFLTVLLTLTSINVSATTYYVSTSGNNENNGTSTSSPWRNINYAVNYSGLKGGDIIYVRSGSYYERVVMWKSGTVGNNITVSNYNGETPTIDGSGQSSPGTYHSGLFEAHGSNVIINGLKVINARFDDNAKGIVVIGPVANVTVQYCVTNNTGSSGISIWGQTTSGYAGATNIVIKNNDISQAVCGGYQENLSIADGVDNFTICYNTVHDCTTAPNSVNIPLGIDAKTNVRNGKIYNNTIYNLSYAGGIYVDGYDKTAYNIDIYNNVIHNVAHSGIQVGAEQAGSDYNINIYNNLVYNNTEHGIAINGSNISTPNNIHNVNIYNNTVYGNGYYGAHILNAAAWGIAFKNNIFSQNGWGNGVTLYTSNKANADVSNNVTDGVMNAWLPGTECYLGNNAISSSPLFAWAGGANFRLTSSSPAINAATTALVPTTDFDANARPSGGGYDIGCYEFGATTLTNLLQNSGFESDFTGWGSDWGYSSIITSPVYQGAKALRIAPSTSGGGRAQVLTTSSFSVGSQYTISAYAMMSATGGPAGTTIGAVCKNSAGTRTGTFVSPDITNTGSYLQTSKTFTVPSATTTMEINVWYPPTTSSVSVYLDNFALVAGSSALKKAQIPAMELAGENSVKPELQIFPNPLSGENMNVRTMGMIEKKTLTILDITGKVIYESALPSMDNNIIEINRLNLKGMYIVKVWSENSTCSQKIVVN